MPGITPDEGRVAIAELVYGRSLVDRAATLELGMFTNSTIGVSFTSTQITEPGSTAYTRAVLTDSSWGTTGGVATYAEQTFLGASTGYGNVYGYFIVTVPSTGTARLLHLEASTAAPLDMSSTAYSYAVTPNITVQSGT